MKQAYLITAYDNFEHLKELIHTLDCQDVYFYLYIDAKVSIPDYISALRTANSICILHDMRVEWGHQSQIITELDLFAKALENPDIEWFHLISGTDFPLKSVEQINEFYQQASDVDCFMETEPLPAHLKDRMELYHFFVNRANNQKPITRYLERKLLALQIRLGLRRKGPKGLPYMYGSNWVDLRRNAVEYLLSRRKKIIRYTKFTSIANEVYKQTFLRDTDFRIVNDNFRYIDWSACAPSPKSLTEEDFQAIINSGKLFARKFNTPESAPLRQRIINHIHDPKQ